MKGGDKLRKALADLSKKVEKGGHVDVGFFEDATYPDGTPVAQVASWMEFGTPTSRPRPFMRNTVAKHSDRWGEALEAALKDSDFDVKIALSAVGVIIESQIRDEIAEGEFEPNKPLTNLLKWRFPKGDYTTEQFLKAVHDLKKGATASSGKPLVWSGRMFQSVTHEVKDGPGES
ncbi:hypothetical protein AD948_05935 [Acetobacter senegalensis]|uniref:Uncharacterized protein n=1 Tax=Acetobacter senegalensis TaxID=446692 RepID=A0A149U4K0_9PROT|nr:hypothetical protein AD948_05935 [Acetobacter senegalensis]